VRSVKGLKPDERQEGGKLAQRRGKGQDENLRAKGHCKWARSRLDESSSWSLSGTPGIQQVESVEYS